jgi:predicted RNA-binding protein YlqC (UPF0109 family)
MKELIETIAKALVDHPGEVRIVEKESERSIVFELSVHPDDMGKVIGKQGRISKALRTVVYAAAINEKRRINIEIV